MQTSCPAFRFQAFELYHHQMSYDHPRLHRSMPKRRACSSSRILCVGYPVLSVRPLLRDIQSRSFGFGSTTVQLTNDEFSFA